MSVIEEQIRLARIRLAGMLNHILGGPTRALGR
jgi:hypothetical protein